MSSNVTFSAKLDDAIAALRGDLLSADGPKISTMRNYRFAILPYKPTEEFKLRQEIRTLSDSLKAKGWNVLSISLHRLLLDRIKATEQDALDSLIAREKRLYAKDTQRGFNHLQEKLAGHIEGPEGIAADVIRIIDQFADEHPEHTDRTVIFIGRAGALYPFFRSSALLKHIDGRTHNIPVVLLYPGERQDVTALSFMGELPADRDYRPRIYP
jgi:hypothetical protein